jgi:hypothetical protein
MGSACPKPASFGHAIMIFDRNSPQSWRHCARYCMSRSVSDPHMIYSAFVHLPVPYEFSTPKSIVANTFVFHFEQLYGHRALTSGACGSPAIVENPKDCFFNFCYEDLSHIQHFLMAEFNVSSMEVRAMSKELFAAQKRIFSAATIGGFAAADFVASSEISTAAQLRITSAASDEIAAAGSIVQVSHIHPAKSVSRVRQSFMFSDDIWMNIILVLSFAVAFLLFMRTFGTLVYNIAFKKCACQNKK